MQSASTLIETHASDCRILIVGASAVGRARYQRYLAADSSSRYAFLEADTVSASVTLGQQHRVDAVLMREDLLEATSLEFLQALKARLEDNHPPVIIVAEQPDLTTAVRAIKLGAEDYLAEQTLTPAQLRRVVRTAAARSCGRKPVAGSPSHTLSRAAQRSTSSQSIGADQQQANSALHQRILELENRVAELQTLIEIIPMGIAIATDPACTQMRCNSYIQQLLGVPSSCNISKSAPADEQLGYRVFQGGQEIPPEELPMQLAARLGIEVRDVEFEAVLPNGTVHQILAYATPLRDSHNQIRGAVGAFLDITYRKQAEARLQESLDNKAQVEATLREQEATIRQQLAELEGIYATAPVGLCFHDANLRYARINDRLAEINGIPAAAHIGRTLHEVLPDMADIIESLHRRVLETGEPILNMELHGATKAHPDSARDWIASYYPLKDSDGNTLGVNVVVQDVTESKQAQVERERLLHQIETEHRFLEQTLQQMPLGVAIASLPTVDLMFHNDEAVRLLRHPIQPDSELKSCVQYGALHVDGQPYAAQEYPIARSAQTGEVIKGEEMLYRRGDGTHTVFAVNAAPIVDQTGRQIAAVSTFEDISRQKQLQQERAQLLTQAEAARAEAEAANRSKDEFVSLVAHELRSPLNAILGWANLLKSRSLDAETTKKGLEAIARNTQAQAQLVEDLLDISRVGRGTLQLARAPINLADAIEAAVATMQPNAEDKGLQLLVQLQSPVVIWGDFNRLQQVVLNLLTNAIKFTPAPGQIDIGLTHDHEQAYICIRDTGQGICPGFLSHVFERFSQDPHSSTGKPGLGLGLAIVQHLVELHGGTVAVESKGEGQGATFTVSLPLLAPGAATS